jgi:hypothetical protein
MKRVTTSQARKNWFRLLDEVIDGEIVVMERRGARILLKRDLARGTRESIRYPNYRKILQAADADQADRWHWEWAPDTADPLTRLPEKH